MGDSRLREDLLTIVLTRALAGPWPQDAKPYFWHWSINSAGQGAFTVESKTNVRDEFPIKKTELFKLSGPQIAAIHRALREARFLQLDSRYGPNIPHPEMMSLTVIMGTEVKQVAYFDPHSFTSSLWTEEIRTKSMPAMQVWLAVCEAVDPDGKSIPEIKRIGEVIRKTATNPR
jgi:hypothetical protein